MVVKGTIFHHKKFPFRNGEIGNKLLILLNTPGKNDPYLFVKTTSQKKDRPSKSGCIENRSLFFIPAKNAFFKEDTWIQLYDIYPFAPDGIPKDPDLKIIGSLDSKLIDVIIDCLFLVGEDDILPEHRRLLRPPLEESLKKLQAKYRKKH